MRNDAGNEERVPGEAEQEPVVHTAGGRHANQRRGEKPALRLEGISKRFGNVVANDNVSLEAYPGEVVALLGENGAGKSTLMSIVSGLLRPDEGTIEINGNRMVFRAPVDAKRHGIGMVYQHLMLVPTMTVAENIALGQSGSLVGLVHLGDVARLIRQLSGTYGLEVDPHARIDELPLGMRQRVEIVRLILGGSQILVFDEPTSILTPLEVKELMEIIRRMTDDGKAVIFITHKLHEARDVASRCVVLRDGRVVGGGMISDIDTRSLVKMMVGREITPHVARARVETGGEVLTVRDLSTERISGKALERVSFNVREGEVFGVAGVDGNGQEELVAALTGLIPPTGGEIVLNDRRVWNLTPRQFIARDGAAIYADRHRDGVALDVGLTENLILPDIRDDRFSRLGWLRRREIQEHCHSLLVRYHVRAASLRAHMRQLSGGNQQRAMVARELSRRPKLLIADQPTRGLDVGAIEFVYERLAEHTEDGGATLLISAELEEVLALSDRIAVMVDGRFRCVVERDEATAEFVGRMMTSEVGREDE